MTTVLSKPDVRVVEARLLSHEDVVPNSYTSYKREWTWDVWKGLANTSYFTKTTQVEKLGAVEVVEVEQDEDDYTATAVVKITMDGTGEVMYFQKNGSYDSYDGHSWNGSFIQVEPQPVSKVEYVAVR